MRYIALIMIILVASLVVAEDLFEKELNPDDIQKAVEDKVNPKLKIINCHDAGCKLSKEGILINGDAKLDLRAFSKDKVAGDIKIKALADGRGFEVTYGKITAKFEGDFKVNEFDAKDNEFKIDDGTIVKFNKDSHFKKKGGKYVLESGMVDLTHKGQAIRVGGNANIEMRPEGFYVNLNNRESFTDFKGVRSQPTAGNGRLEVFGYMPEFLKSPQAMVAVKNNLINYAKSNSVLIYGKDNAIKVIGVGYSRNKLNDNTNVDFINGEVTVPADNVNYKGDRTFHVVGAADAFRRLASRDDDGTYNPNKKFLTTEGFKSFDDLAANNFAGFTDLMDNYWENGIGFTGSYDGFKTRILKSHSSFPDNEQVRHTFNPDGTISGYDPAVGSINIVPVQPINPSSSGDNVFKESDFEDPDSNNPPPAAPPPQSFPIEAPAPATEANIPPVTSPVPAPEIEEPRKVTGSEALMYFKIKAKARQMGLNPDDDSFFNSDEYNKIRDELMPDKSKSNYDQVKAALNKRGRGEFLAATDVLLADQRDENLFGAVNKMSQGSDNDLAMAMSGSTKNSYDDFKNNVENYNRFEKSNLGTFIDPGDLLGKDDMMKKLIIDGRLSEDEKKNFLALAKSVTEVTPENEPLIKEQFKLNDAQFRKLKGTMENMVDLIGESSGDLHYPLSYRNANNVKKKYGFSEEDAQKLFATSTDRMTNGILLSADESGALDSANLEGNLVVQYLGADKGKTTILRDINKLGGSIALEVMPDGQTLKMTDVSGKIPAGADSVYIDPTAFSEDENEQIKGYMDVARRNPKYGSILLKYALKKHGQREYKPFAPDKNYEELYDQDKLDADGIIGQGIRRFFGAKNELDGVSMLSDNGIAKRLSSNGMDTQRTFAQICEYLGQKRCGLLGNAIKRRINTIASASGR